MREKFESIQYLRGFAALIVVFHHARNPAVWLYDPISKFGVGQAGVDIFFVISGFIMYTAAREELPLDFIKRRFVRVVPLYWFATAATFAFYHHSKNNIPSINLVKDVIFSILFIPHYSTYNTGEIWPFLVPGWTLNYEMFFYAIFFVGLFIRRLTFIVAFLLIALTTIGFIFPSSQALWKTYTDPLMLEFLAGFYVAKYRFVFAREWFISLIPLGLLALGLSVFAPGPRILSWGIPATAIVTGAISCEDTGRLPKFSWLAKLGNISFSVYLFQVIAIGLVSRVLISLNLHGPVQLMTMIGASLVCAVILGSISYRLFERPINRRLSNRPTEPVIGSQAVQ
jgi:exopolysaccharide production protein ExoZ